MAARDAAGACIFLDGASRRCSIHRGHGLHALPVSCRIFPRIVLHDARGTFVSLSHFCPTAAALLFDGAGEAAIVDAPPPLTAVGDLDGLDARHEWPPLLRPQVLMDIDSYALWERKAIALLTRDTVAPREALAILEDLTGGIAGWTPGSGALQDVVDAAFDRYRPSYADGGEADRVEAAVKRWLAARLFGAWTAYQADGLAATLRYLRTCLDTFDEEVETDANALEAIRRSDLRILHRAGPDRPGLPSL